MRDKGTRAEITALPHEIPFLDPPELAEMKKTTRERDFVVIGELARLMEDAELQLRYSERS